MNYICPECGGDPFKTKDYDKVQRESAAIQSRFKMEMALHGTKEASWEIERIKSAESMKYLQRKVKKQAQTLQRLEEKLKRLSQQPYAEVPEKVLAIFSENRELPAQLENWL